MVHLHLHVLTHWIHNNPKWGSLAAFLVAFAESLAILGSIVPGTVTMTAIGILAGSHLLPLWSVVICSIVGAAIGDGISYYLGYYCKGNIQRLWPFSRHPQILIKGQAFVTKHGGKSILMGRFVGPVRAIVPLIAGMLSMKPKRYFAASIPAAIAWAPIYMLPGILVGAVSLDIPTDLAKDLIFSVLLFLIALWLIIIVIQFIYNKTHYYFASILDHKWQHWEAQPSKRLLCYLLRHADRPHARGQLLRAISWLIITALFLILYVNVLFHGPLLHWNNFTYHIFRGIHARLLNHIFVVATSFGQKAILLPCFLIIFLWWLIRRQWKIAVHWALVALFAAGAVFIFKHLAFSARPPGILHQQLSSSFPSGHATLAVAFYGMAGFLIGRQLSPATKKLLAWGIIAICVIIALSRLYVGAHWLTDVVGAILLGLSCLWFVVISYLRYPSNNISLKGFVIVLILTLGGFNAWYLGHHYQTDLQNHRLLWKTHTISEQQWWAQQSIHIPIYRKNRLGQPVELLNVQWAGSFNLIQAALKQHGWYNVRSKDYRMQHTKKGLKLKIARHRTLLPKLYDDQPPVIEVLKFLNNQSPPVVLRLWPADITLSPQHIPLWVGTIYFDAADKHLFFTHHITQMIPVVQFSHLLFAHVDFTWETRFVETPLLSTELSHKLSKKLAKRHVVNKIMLIRSRRL